MEYVYGATTATSTTWMPSIYFNGGSTLTPVAAVLPPPRELTALEWLDAEVESTCALARS